MRRIEWEWVVWHRRELSVRRLGSWTGGRMEPDSWCGLAFVVGARALCVWVWPKEN